jgi:hypothetical protein
LNLKEGEIPFWNGAENEKGAAKLAPPFPFRLSLAQYDAVAETISATAAPPERFAQKPT